VSPRLLAVIGGAVLAVVAVVVLLVVLLGGGSEPEEVVDDYYSAIEDFDCDALQDLSTEDYFGSEYESLDACEADVQEFKDSQELADEGDFEVDRTIGEAEIEGDSATVQVDIVVSTAGEDSEFEETITLVKDGDWKVDQTE